MGSSSKHSRTGNCIRFNWRACHSAFKRGRAEFSAEIKAKGLEFPIVILGGITAPLAHEDADCYIDSHAGLCAVQPQGLMPLERQEHQSEEAARNRAEGIRIAYVAATRVRDLLAVPAVADDGAEKRYTDPNDWWIAPMFGAMFPSDPARRKPQVASGCPAFGRDTVLRRPIDQAFNLQPIRPGKYVFPEPGTESSEYSIVWWDPAKLQLGKGRRLQLGRKSCWQKWTLEPSPRTCHIPRLALSACKHYRARIASQRALRNCYSAVASKARRYEPDVSGSDLSRT